MLIPVLNFRSFITILCLIFSISYSNGVNTITPGQSIGDGQTIISPLEEFVLGFFSLGNSPNRYLGIWYNKISSRTLVWVANRDNPITDSSGVLSFGNDGNLVVFDGRGRSLWSTNSSSIAVSNATTITAFLLDSGNLILGVNEVNNDPDKALWQSFEDPTDTYLPEMKIWLTPRSKKNLFVSWKSENDPSHGNFSMGLNPLGLMEIMVWEGLERRWRSGQWNQQIFIGVPRMTAANYLFGYRVSNDGNRTYFTYIVYNSSELFRYQIKWNGIVEQLRWNAVRREWTAFWAEPTRPCEHYNTCGVYGSCSAWNSPICSCLRGFDPKSKTEWDSGNWTSGCVRRTELQCDRKVSSRGGEGDADRFLELDGQKLPDYSVWIPSNDLNDCRDICLRNCSCKAYAYPNGIQCLTWSQDFVDVQQFRQGGEKLYIRLAASEIGSSKSKVRLVIIIVVVLVIILLCISALILWRYRMKLRARNLTSQIEGNTGDGSELTVHSFQEITKATDNFSDANKLGEGGFGPVYKGKLSCGMDVAVKRLSGKSRQGLEEFKNEIILIAKLQHRNLVRLLGYCLEGEEKILIYEYLPNKSLDAFVFANPQEHLDWSKRFAIIEGIARGLLYLHRDSRLRIIHRDLKVSNILLDEEMNPKISDFGIAKISGGNENQANTNRVVGTYGYMAPEYAMGGLFSVKSDVYSFGVLLLEIISSKKNHYYYAEDSTSLIGYAWKLCSEERAEEFIDPSIRDSCPQSLALRCINLGLLCVQDSAADRPIMSTVVRVLESDNVILPSAQQPTFPVLGIRCIEETESSLDSSEVHSRNHMTNTMAVGR